MVKIIIFISILAQVYSQQPRSFCGTLDPTIDEINEVSKSIRNWEMSNHRTPSDEPVNVLVAWHVIHDSNNLGNISNEQIEDAIDQLNYYYNETFNFYFTLDTVTRTENDDWFIFEPNEQANESSEEQEMRSQTVIDPVHYYNVWSVKTEPEDGYITLGWNYFPFWNSENSFWQGTTINYTAILSGTLTHEAGHYFGLYHVFQGGCDGVNDEVSDTPAMAEDANTSCNSSQDSCPDDEGLDPVRNHMNYSNCRDEFTSGQADRGYSITNIYHPGLLENSFYYPNLYYSSLNFSNDSDGDGIFNPGDTIRVRANIGNLWGADGNDIKLTLSTEDARLIILDSIVQFQSPLEAGEVSFGPLLDWFQVSANSEASLGNIQCKLKITSNSTDYPYEISEDISIRLSIDQYGFPITGFVAKSSPVVVDLDNNGQKEIYFGTEEGKLQGYHFSGELINGFPFSTDDNVRSSPAISDLDNDGVDEIIFGSFDGKIYVLDSQGSLKLSYTQSGYIVGSVAIADLDQDGDKEIIFTTQDGNSGKLYAIHNDGNNVEGFPVDVSEKMLVGAAVGDLENDGSVEIVICTWGEKIYAYNSNGVLKPGFPVVSTKRFNAPPTLVDIDNDGSLEIVAGNDNGLLHVLNHDGSEFATFNTGDDIRGGISIADFNNDGVIELLFSGYDDNIHVWDPINGVELDGWPVDMGSNSLSEPLTADLDGDGDLEIIAAIKSGTVHVFHHDGSYLEPFPVNIVGDIESTPVIDDIDNDGDNELVFGTTAGLHILDIKNPKGESPSWKIHRGNTERTGYIGLSFLPIDKNSLNLPNKFIVGASYPNPFNPVTQFDISIVEKNDLSVKVFDSRGRLVNVIQNRTVNPGRYKIKWSGIDRNGSAVSTGIYFIKVVSGKNNSTQKVLLVK